MAKAGRPQKEINWETFEECCKLICTQTEIANVLKVDRHTLSDKVMQHYGEPYSAVYDRFTDDGKKSLRRYQFDLAEKNSNMAIFLGKNWLKQKDNPEDLTASEEAMNNFKQLADMIKAMQDTIKGSNGS